MKIAVDINNCMYKYLLILFLLGNSLFATSQPSATIQGDFPDPTVLYANGSYYSIGTSSEWGPHFPIYTSKDLKHWKQTGFLFSSPPEWAQSSFWAPEYFYHKGLYYVYYSAKRKEDGVSCIGVATSRYPDRGFVDQGIVVDYGTESIDAYVVKEADGLYMTWKAYGLDKRPIELVGSKLSDDGLRLEGEVFSLLQDSARVGIEGQSFVKKDGYYYLFYSAGACCGGDCDYNVQAVRSKTFKGPYEKIKTEVLLGENKDWKCMGHGTFVQGKGDKLYYLFHGYSKEGSTYTGREGLLAELQWTADGEPSFAFVANSDTQQKNATWHHLNSRQKSKPFWQWDFRYSKPLLHYTAKSLQLGGSTSLDNPTGTVLTLRPSSRMYTIGAEIDLIKSSAAQKGVVIYGDKDRAIGVGIEGSKIQFWTVQVGKKQAIAQENLPTGLKKIRIKLELGKDLYCRAFYEDGSNWIEIVPVNRALATVAGISPWDRSPRPGLHFQGPEDEYAVFNSIFTAYHSFN